MATRIGRVAYAKINGQNYRCKHDSSMTFGGFEGEPMAADGKAYVGQALDPITSTFEITLLEANDLDVEELSDLIDMAIDFVFDTGQIYRIGDANWATPPSYQSGEVSCSGFGKKAKKVV